MRIRKDVQARLRIYWGFGLGILWFICVFAVQQQAEYNTQQVWNDSAINLAERQYDLYLMRCTVK